MTCAAANSISVRSYSRRLPVTSLIHLCVGGILLAFAPFAPAQVPASSQARPPAAAANESQQRDLSAAQPPSTIPAARPAATTKPAKSQAELEADFAKMLTGATLEGSFTMTAGGDGSRLSRDKYILGEVKKLAGDLWLIQTRVQYGNNDYTVPLPLPVQWAGDTPVIIVDEVTIPGQGTFSARVMFFADHYSGYWKHGDRGGNMFGVIHRAPAEATKPATPNTPAAAADADKK
jgi:hypothetical protein